MRKPFISFIILFAVPLYAGEFPHGVTLTNEERKLFIMWDMQDNISQWEKIRAERIEKIQGNKNKFIK